jgi:DNA-binding HxlR family transcriptional regulator
MVSYKISVEEFVKGIKNCPIETAFLHIGKKWSINIIRDLFLGKKRFQEFLEGNPELSGKVLSQRLRELENDGLIKKKIVSKTPLKAEYGLTDKGKNLDRILYEIVTYSMKNYSNEVFKNPSEFNERMCSIIAKKTFGIK